MLPINQLDDEVLDIDKQPEEEDEVSAAGMHVTGPGDADDDDDEEKGSAAEALDDEDDIIVLPIVEVGAEEEAPKDGLQELEELEASLDEPPIEVETDDQD